MRFVSDFRPIDAACSLLDDLLAAGPVPDDILARLEAWADDDAEPGAAIELCVNGERYHATDTLLSIITDLWLHGAGLGYGVKA